LDRLEDNHLQSISVNTVANGNGDLIGLYSQACLTGFKQGTVQVFLNGQLLTEGVDWQEAVAYTDLDSLPGEGVAVGAVKLLYTGNVSDSHVIYAVKHSDEIAYGSGSGSSEQRSSTAPAPDSGSADTGSADTGSADTGSADTGSADTGSSSATGSLSETSGSADSGSEEEVGYGYGYGYGYNNGPDYSHLSAEERQWMEMDTLANLYGTGYTTTPSDFTIFDHLVSIVNFDNGLDNALMWKTFTYRIMEYVNSGLRKGYDWDTFHDLLAEALDYNGNTSELITLIQNSLTNPNIWYSEQINNFGSQYAESTFNTPYLNHQFSTNLVSMTLGGSGTQQNNHRVNVYEPAVSAAESTYVDIETPFIPA